MSRVPCPPEHRRSSLKASPSPEDQSKLLSALADIPAPGNATSNVLPLTFPISNSPSELGWTSVPTEEPLTPEMKTEVIMELKRYYYSYRKDDIFRKETKFCWMREPLILKLRGLAPPKQLSPEQLERFCNKPTSLYWAHSAQVKHRCPGLTFGCIYKEWFRYHADEPNIEFGHFFASPIRVTSTGPTTIRGILKAHKSFCDQAASLLDKIERGEISHDYRDPWPNPQHHKLLPLCRAITVFLDELLRDVNLDPDGFIRLDEVLQRQDVLMIRTGDESSLSAPISFESIGAQSLPLARSDISANDDIDAVRVPLATAVRFIANLQQREEAAFPDSRNRSVVDTSLCPRTADPGYVAVSADGWADRIMQGAEAKGIDNVVETWDAVRRVKAAKYGRPFYEPSPYHFNGRWK